MKPKERFQAFVDGLRDPELMFEPDAGPDGEYALITPQPVAAGDGTSAELKPARGISLAQGSIIVFVVQVAATGARYVSQILFARGGGPRDYGYYSYAYSWVYLLIAPVAVGFTIGVLKYVPEYAETNEWSRLRGLIRRSNEITWLASLAVAAVAAAVIIPLFGASQQRAVSLLIAFALLPLAAIVNLDKQFARAARHVLGAYGIGELLPPVVAVVATVPLLVAGVHLSGVTMLLLTASGFIVAMPFQSRIVRRLFPKSYGGAKPIFETREWLRVAAPLFLLVTITGAMNYADILLVGSFRNATETGLYSAANRLANIVSFVLVAVTGILAPMLVSTHRSGDRGQLEKLMQSAIRWSLVPSILFAVPMLVFPGTLLSVFGPGFAGAATPLRILAIGQLVNAATGPVGLLPALTGHEDVVALVSAVAIISGLILYLILIPTVGIVGAAIGSSTTLTIFNVWMYVVVRRRYQIRLFRWF